MGAHETKTFKSGNSVALRLPRALGIGPDEKMVIEQHGTTLTVRPAIDPVEEKRKIAEMIEKIRALNIPYVEKRERIEFPERGGL